MDRLKTRQRLAKLNALGSPAPVLSPKIETQPDDEINNSHLASKIRVASLINESIPDMSYPPKNTLTRITAKELEDFQRNENTPITIGGKTYRLHPASIPEPEFDEEDNETDIQEALKIVDQKRAEIGDRLQRIVVARRDLIQQEKVIRNLDTRFNLFMRLNTIKPQPPDAVRDVEDNYRARKPAAERERDDIILFIENMSAAIDVIRDELAAFSANLPEEIANNNERKIRNKAKLAAYEENLRLLNRNFNLTQEQGESNEAYVARIASQTQAIEDPNLLVDRFNLYEARRFKDNLKDIIRDISVIESAYNTLFQDDDSSIPEINKTFALIKSRYEKTFGNVQLNERDLIQFLRQMIENPEGSIRIGGSRFGDPQFDEAEVLTTLGAEEPAAADEDPLLAKYRAMSQGRRYTIPALIETIKKSKDYVVDDFSVNVNGEEAYLLKGRGGGISINYKGVIKPASQTEKAVLVAIYVGMLESIKEAGQSNETYANYYRALNRQVNASTYGEYGEGIKGSVDLSTAPSVVALENPSARGTESPIGIQHETLPKSCTLGKVDVDLNKLFYKNVLSCKHKGMKINGVKNTPVGDDFVKIIMDLCKGKYPSTKDLNKLGAGETELFDALLYLAGLHKRVENTANKSVEKLKQRLTLISGEFEAGNTNKMLYDEAKDIVFKLHHLGEITQNSATAFLKQFK